MDITTLVNNYTQYVFGSVAYASLALIFAIVLVGVRRGWSLDSFIIVLTPLISVMSSQFLPYDISPLWLIGIGLLIGFGLVALLRR